MPEAKQIRREFKKDPAFRAKMVKSARHLVDRLVQRGHVSLYQAIHPDGDLVAAQMEDMPQLDDAYSFAPKRGALGHYLSITAKGKADYHSGTYCD